ncbi:MAG: S-layer homology domain-containing protein [Kineothrix sp.]
MMKYGKIRARFILALTVCGLSGIGSTSVKASEPLDGAVEELSIEEGMGTTGDGQDASPISEDVPFFTDYSLLLEYVREQMVNRSAEFRFSVPYSMTTVDGWIVHNKVVADCMNQIYSISNKDGDYLRSNYVKTKWTGARESDVENDIDTFVIRNIYTSTAEEEAQVDAMLPEVLSSLGLEGKSDYEKIKIIHDWIVKHVTYTQTGEYGCHSTYAALVKGEAVCQGYASLFYRMCREVGINARYIPGYSFVISRTPHAWNLVELEGKWYEVDCTADDHDDDVDYYSSFLKSQEDFLFCERNSQYNTPEFHEAHPMAEISYEAVTVKETDSANPSFTLTAADGSRISTTAEGQPKVLFLMDPDNGRSTSLLKDMMASEWMAAGGFDFHAVDGTAADAASAVEEYCRVAGLEITDFFPYIVIIDQENKVRQVSSGFYKADVLGNVLKKYSNATPQQPADPVPDPSPTPEPTPAPGTEPTDGDTGNRTPQQPAGKWPFTDVAQFKGFWKYDAISVVYEKGLMNGLSGSSLFDPDGNLTRAMFATILYRMAGQPEVIYSRRFSDVLSGKWYSDAILWASAEGIVEGYSDGSYGIHDDITREQIAKMLYLYGSRQGYDVSRTVSLEPFTDTRQVSSWAAVPIQWAAGAGMIGGKPNGDGTFRLDPKGEATRAECAKMVGQFLKSVGE